MNRKLVIVLSIVGILLGAVLISKLLIALKEVPKKEKPPVENRFVQTERVVYDSLRVEVNSSGRLKSFNEITLSSEVAGKLTESALNFKAGVTFNKGDVLIRVENLEFVYQAKARKSKFLQSIAAILPDIKVDFPDELQKWNLFFESVDVNQPLPEFPLIENSREKIFLSARNLLNDYYTVKADDSKLAKHSLIASFSGTIKEVFAEPGSVINAGVKLATITRTDLYEVEVPVSIEEITLIKVGDKVKIKIPYSAESTEGVIHRIAHVVNESTQSVSAFIRLYNTGKPKLLDGMYVSASLYGEVLPKAMTLSRNALVNDNQVYLLKDGMLKLATITILKVNAKTVLFNGVEPGELLITEPVVNVTDKAKFEALGMENSEPTKEAVHSNAKNEE